MEPPRIIERPILFTQELHEIMGCVTTICVEFQGEADYSIVGNVTRLELTIEEPAGLAVTWTVECGICDGEGQQATLPTTLQWNGSAQNLAIHSTVRVDNDDMLPDDPLVVAGTAWLEEGPATNITLKPVNEGGRLGCIYIVDSNCGGFTQSSTMHPFSPGGGQFVGGDLNITWTPDELGTERLFLVARCYGSGPGCGQTFVHGGTSPLRVILPSMDLPRGQELGLSFYGDDAFNGIVPRVQDFHIEGVLHVVGDANVGQRPA